MKYFLALSLVPYFLSAADFSCTATAPSKTDNVVSLCAKSEGGSENEARNEAYQDALKAFAKFCEKDFECAGRMVRAEAMKTMCQKVESKYVCDREFRFSLGDRYSASNDPVTPDSNGIVTLEGTEVMKPFYYRNMSSLPKVKRGMGRDAVFEKFGKPSQIREAGDVLVMYYKGRDFCEGDVCSIRVDKKTTKVVSYSDIRYEYTDILK